MILIITKSYYKQNKSITEKIRIVVAREGNLYKGVGVGLEGAQA